MTSEAVVFEKLADDVHPPERSTDHSAGYDVRAYLRRGPVRVHRQSLDRVVDVRPDPVLVLEPGDRALVPTGFRARLPAGCEAQIRIRSSLAWERGLIVPNAPGTIDADYPDEWFVLVQNASRRPRRIEHGERIAQVVLASYRVLPWIEGEVRISTDRVGGLGSTGR